jgi:cell division septum initiation protein DivIVA
MIRRRRKPQDGVAKLLADTQDMVGKLLKENRALKQRNAKLAKELDRVSAGWDELKKLARAAPRRRR